MSSVKVIIIIHQKTWQNSLKCFFKPVTAQIQRKVCTQVTTFWCKSKKVTNLAECILIHYLLLLPTIYTNCRHNTIFKSFVKGHFAALKTYSTFRCVKVSLNCSKVPFCALVTQITIFVQYLSLYREYATHNIHFSHNSHVTSLTLLEPSVSNSSG